MMDGVPVMASTTLRTSRARTLRDSTRYVAVKNAIGIEISVAITDLLKGADDGLANSVRVTRLAARRVVDQEAGENARRRSENPSPTRKDHDR